MVNIIEQMVEHYFNHYDTSLYCEYSILCRVIPTLFSLPSILDYDSYDLFPLFKKIFAFSFHDEELVYNTVDSLVVLTDYEAEI
jgi:hypothetical protein